METNYFRLPQPEELSVWEKEDAMGAYLMMFAALATSLPLPIINLIAALIYYSINRKKSRFVHFHSLQSFLSQYPTTLMNWGLLFWGIQIYVFKNTETHDLFYSFVGFSIVSNLLYIIFSLIAAIKARKGQFYYFIFLGTYTYHRVYNKKNEGDYDNEESTTTKKLENKPPF